MRFHRLILLGALAAVELARQETRAREAAAQAEAARAAGPCPRRDDALNTPADSSRQPHTNPVVTVAIRSDGSVESVKLQLSSGVPAIDAAIDRIVRSQAA